MVAARVPAAWIGNTLCEVVDSEITSNAIRLVEQSMACSVEIPGCVPISAAKGLSYSENRLYHLSSLRGMAGCDGLGKGSRIYSEASCVADTTNIEKAVLLIQAPCRFIARRRDYSLLG